MPCASSSRRWPSALCGRPPAECCAIAQAASEQAMALPTALGILSVPSRPPGDCDDHARFDGRLSAIRLSNATHNIPRGPPVAVAAGALLVGVCAHRRRRQGEPAARQGRPQPQGRRQAVEGVATLRPPPKDDEASPVTVVVAAPAPPPPASLSSSRRPGWRCYRLRSARSRLAEAHHWRARRAGGAAGQALNI